MGNCIDDSLADHLWGHLVRHGCLWPVFSRANGQVDLGKHKIHRLINKIKCRSPIDLIEWDRLLDLDSMEMRALDFRGLEEPLWSGAE